MWVSCLSSLGSLLIWTPSLPGSGPLLGGGRRPARPFIRPLRQRYLVVLTLYVYPYRARARGIGITPYWGHPLFPIHIGLRPLSSRNSLFRGTAQKGILCWDRIPAWFPWKHGPTQSVPFWAVCALLGRYPLKEGFTTTYAPINTYSEHVFIPSCGESMSRRHIYWARPCRPSQTQHLPREVNTLLQVVYAHSVYVV